AGGAPGNLLNDLFRQVIGQRGLIDERCVELGVCLAVRDTPRTDRIVPFVLGIHGRRKNVSAGFSAGLAWLARFFHAAALDGKAMVFELRQVHWFTTWNAIRNGLLTMKGT